MMDKSKREDQGWKPGALTDEESLTTEKRSLDIGESGQIPPGGYYNHQSLNKPNRSASSRRDDDIIPPGRL
jgi:hypothetical protein